MILSIFEQVSAERIVCITTESLLSKLGFAGRPLMSDIDGYKDLVLEKEYLQGKTTEKYLLYTIL
jgi:hypothetical protein